jgi:hypothetical protein
MDDSPISLITNPEVNWTFTDIQTWMPDAFLDMHSEVNGESSSQTSIDCFFLHDGLYDSAMIDFCNNISRGFTGVKDYWPETGPRSATGGEMAATNVRTRLGIHPAVDMEHPHDDLRNSSAHPVTHNPQTIADWKDWGRRIDLGIFDYYGEAPIIHDVAIVFANTTKTGCKPLMTLNQQCTTNITLNVANHGEVTETMAISVYGEGPSGTILLGQANIALNTLESVYITLVWNASSIARGNYTLWAALTPVYGEVNISNNNFTLGLIIVTMPGDINGDGKVNILDIVRPAIAFGSTINDPKYDPNADLNDNGIINILDVSKVAIHFGEIAH